MGARAKKPSEPNIAEVGEQQPAETGEQAGGKTRRRRSTANTVTADAKNGSEGTAGVEGIRIVGEDGNDEISAIPAPNSVKPKRKTTRKKKQPKYAASNDPIVKDMITGLVETVFGLVAFRAGQHWALTREEAEKITEPTIRIMDRFNVLDKVAASSDFIALGLAATAVFTPRIVYSVQLSQHNKKMKEMGLSHVQPVGQKQGSSANGENTQANGVPDENRTVTGASTSTLQHNVKESIESGIIHH